MENQIRGLLKSLGIIIGKAGTKAFPTKVGAILREAAHLRPLIELLLQAHSVLITQILKYDEQLNDVAKSDQTVRRLMTVPEVGRITALAFTSTVDKFNRFKRAAMSVPILASTPRRYQSGELDRTGRISKRGDRLTRYYLFEAANVLLKVVRRGSPLKAWGLKLAKRRIGPKKAKIAVTRKLATILHCIWTEGTQYDWGKVST